MINEIKKFWAEFPIDGKVYIKVCLIFVGITLFTIGIILIGDRWF